MMEQYVVVRGEHVCLAVRVYYAHVYVLSPSLLYCREGPGCPVGMKHPGLLDFPSVAISSNTWDSVW